MRIRNLAAGVGRKLGLALKRTQVGASAAILAGGMMFAGSAGAQVFSEDFESLTLTAGTPSYTDVIPGWTRDNSGMSSASTNLAYDGGTAMNISEWVGQQGAQLGRNTTGGLSGNNAIIFDGDAWQDFSGGESLGFNSYWSTDIDISGVDQNNLQVTFGYEFASYDSQRGLVEVSFDGGTSYTALLDLDSDIIGGSVLSGGTVSYSAGTDFTPSGSTMTLRVGKIDADNDWWFAFDDLVVTVGDPTLSVDVDRDTGDISLKNGTNSNVSILGYSISSADGGLIVAEFDSLTDAGTPSWNELAAVETEFAEGVFDDNALELTSGGTPIALGDSWLASATEDLVFEYLTSTGDVIQGAVNFSGNNDEQFAVGDFNTDGEVDALDWEILRDNQRADLSGDTIIEAYLRGDLDGDLDNDFADFAAFKQLFEAENGAGSLAIAIANSGNPVPEPSSIVIVAGAVALGGLIVKRTKK